MKTIRRVILSCMVGNTLEWYDFALYSYFATIIGRLFFPSMDPLASLLMSYGAFAAGFLMRPIGALAFGYIGDHMGRKPALTLSIYLMAIPTTLIGLLPTYEYAGLLAPILLTLCRLVQGFSMGGEFIGSLIFMTEYSTDKNRGLVGSFGLFSALIGVVIGSSTAVLINHIFSADVLEAWGWRIPFLLSCFGGLVGAYMRRSLAETPQYNLIKAQAHRSSPLKLLFSKYLSHMGLVLLLDALLAVAFFMLASFLPGYLMEVQKFERAEVLIIQTINMIIIASVTLWVGWLSDYIDRRKILSIAAIAMILFAYPLFLLFGKGSIVLAMLAQMGLVVIAGVYMGPLAAVLVNIFPTEVKYSGLSLSHNLAMAILGGTAPLVGAFLIAHTGDNASPAAYLMVAGAISLVGVYFVSRCLKV